MTGLLVAWLLIWLFVALTLIVRRFHDRGKGAIWPVLFYGLPVSFFVAAYFMGWPPREDFPGAKLVMYTFFPIVFLNNVWYMLELLAFRGTRGSNRFGPDPLAKLP